ncbi:unnamed protein product [Agarophyton chilense]
MGSHFESGRGERAVNAHGSGLSTLLCGKDVKVRAKSVIGRIFGSDVLSSDKYVTMHQSSIFCRLKHFADAADEDLDPCEVLNRTLSELVFCLQTGTGGTEHDEHDDPCLLCEIQKQVCWYIDTNVEICRRASVIRQVATRAESRMELYYARKLLYCDVNIDLGQTFAQRIREAAIGFPYIDNYVNMTQKEFEVVSELLSSRNSMQDWRRSEKSEDEREALTRVVFCGSGPLPLSGILLSACANAKMHVTLVDRDEEAVAISRKLLSKWELSGIVPANRIQVVCADANKLTFCRRARPHEGHMVCDVVFVAALLSSEARHGVLTGSAQFGEDAPLVVVRSAHGVTARVAYDKLSCEVGDSWEGGATRVALVVPTRHVSHAGDVVDEARGVRATHVFHASILNSLEVFAWTLCNFRGDLEALRI